MVIGQPVVLDLTGKRSHEVERSSSRLFWIGPSVPPGQPGCVVPRDLRLNWSALDALTPLRQISYTGADPAFIEYLRERADLREVEWNPEPLTDLDLGGTHVQRLMLQHSGARLRVRLADPTDFVSLQGSTVGLTVRAARPPALWLYRVSGPAAIDGLDALTDLGLSGCADLRLARLAGYPALESLRISGAPILDIEELARFRSLRSLTIEDCYDFDGTRFPGPDELPSMSSLRISGVRGNAAGAVRDRWRDHPGLGITAVRSERWLLKHQDHPFRGWADDDLPHARAAATAWGKALAALARTASDDRLGGAEALREFVARFNRMDARDGLDTTQVEDIAEAYDQLATRHAALRDDPELSTRFDEWRTF